MGIFSKLFGKKKKEEATPVEESKQEKLEDKKEHLKKEARNITLEEVERELDDLDKIEEEQPTHDDKEVNTKTAGVKTTRRQQTFVPADEDEEEKPVVEPTPKPEEIKEPEKEVEPVKETKKPSSKTVYHIKKHEKGWQIIGDGAEKALRVFDYQKDAVQHAKENDIEYLLYRADGTLRKDQ